MSEWNFGNMYGSSGLRSSDRHLSQHTLPRSGSVMSLPRFLYQYSKTQASPHLIHTPGTLIYLNTLLSRRTRVGVFKFQFHSSVLKLKPPTSIQPPDLPQRTQPLCHFGSPRATA